MTQILLCPLRPLSYSRKFWAGSPTLSDLISITNNSIDLGISLAERSMLLLYEKILGAVRRSLKLTFVAKFIGFPNHLAGASEVVYLRSITSISRTTRMRRPRTSNQLPVWSYFGWKITNLFCGICIIRLYIFSSFKYCPRITDNDDGSSGRLLSLQTYITFTVWHVQETIDWIGNVFDLIGDWVGWNYMFYWDLATWERNLHLQHPYIHRVTMIGES